VGKVLTRGLLKWWNRASSRESDSVFCPRVWAPGVRIDPLRLLTGCRKMRLNQAPLNLRGLIWLLLMGWSKRGNINIHVAALVTIGLVQCNTLVARCSKQLLGPADWVFVTLGPYAVISLLLLLLQMSIIMVALLHYCCRTTLQCHCHVSQTKQQPQYICPQLFSRNTKNVSIHRETLPKQHSLQFLAEGDQSRRIPDTSRQRVPGSCCSRREGAVA